MMTQRILLLFSFLFAINYSRCQAADYSNVSLSTLPHTQELCLNEAALARHALLTVLRKLHIYKQYWQSQQVRQTHTLLPRFVHVWKYGMPVERVINDALAQIETAINHNADLLGILLAKQQAVEMAPDDPDQLHDLTNFISNALLRSNISIPPYPSEQFHHDITRNNALIKKYPEIALASLTQYAKPHHLRRHWGKYSILGILGCIAGYCYLYKYQQSMQLITQIKTAATEFCNNHILIPFKNSFDLIFQPKDDPGVVPKKTYESELQTLESMMQRYLKQRNTGLFALLGLSTPMTDEDINRKVAKAIALGGRLPKIIRQDIVMQNEHPILNASFVGNYVQLIRIEGQQIKVMGLRAGLMMSDLQKASALNFELFTALPASILLYGLWQVGTRQYNNAVHVPIQNAIYALQTLLSSYRDTHLDAKGNGLVYYWTDIIKNFTNFLSLPQQVALKTDLDQLQNLNYSIAQKKEIIARLYPSHAFMQGNR